MELINEAESKDLWTDYARVLIGQLGQAQDPFTQGALMSRIEKILGEPPAGLALTSNGAAPSTPEPAQLSIAAPTPINSRRGRRVGQTHWEHIVDGIRFNGGSANNPTIIAYMREQGIWREITDKIAGTRLSAILAAYREKFVHISRGTWGVAEEATA